MFKNNPKLTISILVAALTLAFEQMNLSRPMNEDQIIDLADTLIDSSNEDYFSIEDLILFLQGLTRGQYGMLYESMDIPKFMEKFEMYRQQRHDAYENIKYENQVNFKSMGDTERISDNEDREKELTRDAIGDYLREKYKNI